MKNPMPGQSKRNDLNKDLLLWIDSHILAMNQNPGTLVNPKNS